MEKVYENLLERLDKTRMESEGVYITFYESLGEYIKEQQEFGYSREEVIQQMNDHVDVEEIQGSFIMLESQSSDGMYVWHEEDTEDIIEFLESETAYKNYINKGIDEMNIVEIIEQVENFKLGLEEDPAYEEIGGKGYIVHYVSMDEHLEVFFAKKEDVDVEHVNELADLYDYDKVVAYRVDSDIEWIE